MNPSKLNDVSFYSACRIEPTDSQTSMISRKSNEVLPRIHSVMVFTFLWIYNLPKNSLPEYFNSFQKMYCFLFTWTHFNFLLLLCSSFEFILRHFMKLYKIWSRNENHSIRFLADSQHFSLLCSIFWNRDFGLKMNKIVT